MNIPGNLLFTREHEWVRIEGSRATVGISDYAQHALGDVTFVELPAAGKKMAKGDKLAAVESVKAASDVYSPLDGAIVEVNEALADKPELINEDPYGEGWIFRLKTTAALEGLLDAKAYEAIAIAEDEDDEGSLANPKLAD